MAKIDTSTIKGFDEMSAEDKVNALMSYEYDDNADQIQKLKDSVSNANSQAAEWKKKHNALLDEDERKNIERDEELQTLKTNYDNLVMEKTIAEYTAKYTALGYDSDLANSTAIAMANGDVATVFANQGIFNKKHDEKIKAEMLGGSPNPPAGTGVKGTNYNDKISDAMNRGDNALAAYYMRMAQNE